MGGTQENVNARPELPSYRAKRRAKTVRPGECATITALVAAVVVLGCSASPGGPHASGAAGEQGGQVGAPSEIDAGQGGAGGAENPSAGTGGQAVFSSCSPEELAMACGSVECGTVDGCIQECGSCMQDEVCFEGRCTLPNCTSAVAQCECGDLAFSLSTYQSCSLGTMSGTELDGEAFISIGGQEHRVLAIDRWGSGHLIAWCDASTIGDLMLAFDAAGYLAQKTEPRIASFGNLPTCQPGFLQPTSIPESVTYLGAELPLEYMTNPAKLAADWDALVFCGFHTEWSPGLASLIQAYVTEYGRGLLAAMDYLGYDIQPADFEQMSAVTGPSGVIFNPISLDWADATANVAIECVPDLRPVIQ